MDIILNEGSLVTDGECTYRIIRCIGKGASAAAYMAECRNGNLSGTCILKEYNPSKLSITRNDDGSLSCDDTEDFSSGMKRFMLSGYRQNEIRQKTNMRNQTPPVSRIFEANGTAYIDVSCYDGTTLDRMTELTIAEYTEILLAVSKNVSAYHSSGCLCLDLKPENIFIILDSAGRPVTQLVEFIDFDSVRTEESTDKYRYYTREWAAPEQTDSFSASKISEASDIYTLGELAFRTYFGRHSEDSEHRGFSKFSFEKCRKEFRTVLSRPSVQKLLTKLFRNTLRPSVSNRFPSVNDVISIFEKLAAEMQAKDFVIPVLPHVSPYFAGRENEIRWISENLELNGSVWLHGTGGIGKSTLIRNFIHRNKTDYDVIIYLEFSENIVMTFTDDRQLKLSTVRKSPDESPEEYFIRKLEMLKTICAGRDVLLVTDNFEGMISKEFSELTDCGWHTVTVSRRRPPDNSFASLEIKAISDTEEIYRLISLNLGRSVSKNEKPYFDEIIKLTEGHTLVIELIARQIKAGNMSVSEAAELIDENGFSRFSDSMVSSYKDGEEIYDTLSVIISALFSRGRMNDVFTVYMKVLALTDCRGLERSIVRNILKLSDNSVFAKLSEEGWIYDGDIIRVHPVIAETVRSWSWPDSEKDIQVMKYHKRVIAVYESMEDFSRIMRISEDADAYAELHQRNIITAMALDMRASFYDAILGGAYESDDSEDLEIIEKLRDTLYYAVEYASGPQNTEEEEILCNFLLSLASVHMRTGRNERDDIASECISRARSLIRPEFENFHDALCTCSMVSAWYHTLIDYDTEKAHMHIENAEDYAASAYPTSLELIDIFYIPAADIYFTLGEYETAVKKLSEAAELCRENQNILQYADKLAELLRCMLDVYFENYNYEKCAELIYEIDEINNKYSDQGIFRLIDPFIIETVLG